MSNLPEAHSREEILLKAIAEHQKVDCPGPKSRIEIYLRQIMENGSISPEEIQAAVNAYLAEHPLDMDASLVDSLKAAPAGVVGERLSELKGDISEIYPILYSYEEAENVDINIVVADGYDIDNGVLKRSTSNYLYTAIVDVVSGQTYLVSLYSSLYWVEGIIFLDSGDSLVSYDTNLIGAFDVVDYEISVPANATKMIIQGSNSSKIACKKKLPTKNQGILQKQEDICYIPLSYGDTNDGKHIIYSSTKLISTVFKLLKNVYVSFDTSKVSVGVWEFSDIDGNNGVWKGWNTDKFILSSSKFYRILVKNNDLTSISDDIKVSFSTNETNLLEEILSLKSKITDISNLDSDNIMLSIQRQGMLSCPEQSDIGFISAYENGFRYVECAVRFTSDNVPVLLHDSTINRTARNVDGSGISETINIADITLEQANQYDYGYYYGYSYHSDSPYTGMKIPTFEDFLKKCKSLGMIAFVESKIETESSWRIICDTVKKYGMSKRTIFNLYNGTHATTIIEKINKPNISIATNTITEGIASKAISILPDCESVYVNTSYSTFDKNDENVVNVYGNDIGIIIWGDEMSGTDANILTLVDSPICGIVTNDRHAGLIIKNATLN